MTFELPDLPYDMNALEPHISQKTLEYHHRKHQQGYLTDLNELIKGTRFHNLDLETIIKIADGPIFNNAALVWNHTFYFECLKPGDKNSPENSFREVINKNFGSFEFFKSSFVKAVGSLFGAGWVWLVLNHVGSIEIMAKSNAGNPLRMGYIPLMACDVWEHAYYLDYQNRRDSYADAFWKLINWSILEKRYYDAIN